MKGKTYTFIDLFAGCGGLTEGFLQEGHFKSLAHIEWEKPMVKTLRNRLVQKWGYSKDEALKDVIYFDIQRTEELLFGNWSPEMVKKYSNYNAVEISSEGLSGIVSDTSVDLIIGGPPCQAYSIHGRATDKNSMQDDYRNYLFESFIKVVKAFQPKVLVFENVPGILTAKPGGKNVTERIFEAFSSAGYEVLSSRDMCNAVFNAVDYRVAQQRKRVIILGVKEGCGITLTELYNSIRAEQSEEKPLTVRDVLGEMPVIIPLNKPYKKGRRNVSHEVVNPSPKYKQHEPRYNSIRDINVFREWVKNKMNYIPHKEKIDFYRAVTRKDTLYAKYKNLEWDKPSHTIVAHLSKDGMMFIHPDANQARSITIREAASLMGFPLDFEFLGSMSYCYKMIGNAVPVPLAKSIARGVRKVLDKKR